MKKRLLNIFKNETDYQFAIRKETLVNGTVRFTPVAKIKGMFHQWIPIVKVNETFAAIDIPNDFCHTEETAFQFVHGFFEEIKRQNGSKILSINYQKL